MVSNRRNFAQQSGKLILILFLISNLFAAKHYVRDNASGDNNGTDWTNAWEDNDDWSAADIARGDTVYYADGTYVGDTFDDAISGSTINYILKATASEHGTETGWNAAYGDGVAHFYEASMAAYASVITFETNYWVFDGKVGSDTSGHGFKVSTDDNDGVARVIMFSDNASNITLAHFEAEGPGEDINYNTDVIYCNTGADNITIQYCWLHDVARNLITQSGGDNWLLERSVLNRNHNTADIHQQGIQGGPTVTNTFTIRYNIFIDINGTGYIVPLGGTAHRKWYVYGNLFYVTNAARYLCPSGLFGDTSTTEADSMYFYNNTIADIDDESSYDAGVDFNWESAVEIFVYDNVWYNCNLALGWSNVTAHDYNAADEDLSEAHDQLIDNTIFTNYNSDDFSLSGATDAGLDLGSPYNQDMDGNTRGADGVWDRGYDEYDSGVFSAGNITVGKGQITTGSGSIE